LFAHVFDGGEPVMGAGSQLWALKKIVNGEFDVDQHLVTALLREATKAKLWRFQVPL
jgi:hypothetical protein